MGINNIDVPHPDEALNLGYREYTPEALLLLSGGNPVFVELWDAREVQAAFRAKYEAKVPGRVMSDLLGGSYQLGVEIVPGMGDDSYNISYLALGRAYGSTFRAPFSIDQEKTDQVPVLRVKVDSTSKHGSGAMISKLKYESI